MGRRPGREACYARRRARVKPALTPASRPSRTELSNAATARILVPAGTSFGKRAVISGEPHATDVCADTELDLFVLTPEAMRELERRAPRARARRTEARGSRRRGATGRS